MKSLINRRVLPILVTVLIYGAPTFAQSQGGGNGGDVQRSTVADVLKVIQQVAAEPTDPVWLDSNGYGYWVSTDSIYRDFFDLSANQTSTVLKKLFVTDGAEVKFFNTAIYSDLKRTKLDIRTSGRCPVINNDELNISASTQKHLGASICIDANALATLPKADLIIQIKGLLAHEFTHHFGFGEADANQIQSLVISNSQKTIQRAGGRLAYAVQNMQRTFIRLEQNTKVSTATDTILCTDIGMLLGLDQEVEDLNEMFGLATERETGTELAGIEGNKLEVLREKLKSLSSFCGNYYLISDQWGTQSIQYSSETGSRDRNLLNQSMAAFKMILKPVFEAVTRLKWSDF